MRNRQQKVMNNHIKVIHKEQMQIAKKSEYLQAREIKERIAQEKVLYNQDHLKNTIEVNARVKEWKKRAKSISHQNHFVKLQDIKDRYKERVKQVVQEVSVFEKRTEKASVFEDHLVQKL